MEHEEFIRSGACTMTTVNGGLCCGGKCAAVRVAISFWSFFTNLSGPSTPGRRFVMDQSWFESCTARAEPCQLAVWKVKMCSLTGSDVSFVRKTPYSKLDISFLDTHRHTKTHRGVNSNRWTDIISNINICVIVHVLTSKTVQSPRRCSHSLATCTHRDRTGGGSLHFLHVVN